jgi:hypothetical protein
MSTITVSTEVVGIVEQQQVRVVHMERETFLELVEGLITTGEDENHHHRGVEFYAPIADDMRASARAMIWFPLGDWIAVDRGCGCLVGEYLVAQDIIDRQALAAKGSRSMIHASVQDSVCALDHGHDLIQFGAVIDRKVKGWIEAHDINSHEVDVVVVDDPED